MDRLNQETTLRNASIKDLVWLEGKLRAERKRRGLCEHWEPIPKWTTECKQCIAEFSQMEYM